MAEECGKKWTLAEDGWYDGPDGNEGVSYEHMLDLLPDYLNDRNAMADAIAQLEGQDRFEFLYQLDCVVSSKHPAGLNDIERSFFYVNATADQLADAFLIVKGKLNPL